MAHPSKCCLARQRAKNILAAYSIVSFALGVALTTATCVFIKHHPGSLDCVETRHPCQSTFSVS